VIIDKAVADKIKFICELVIKNGNILATRFGDILLKDGQIREIGTNLKPKKSLMQIKIISCRDLWTSISTGIGFEFNDKRGFEKICRIGSHSRCYYFLPKERLHLEEMWT